MNVIEDGNREHATRGGSGKIGCVERACVRRKPRQRDANHHSTEDEWNGDERKCQSGPPDFRFRIGGNVQLHCKADRARQSEKQSGIRKRHVRIPLFHHFDKDRTCGKSEHGEGDRHEREVIPHRDAEDPRQEQFELQQRKRRQE